MWNDTAEVSYNSLFLKFSFAFHITQKDTTVSFTCGSNPCFPLLHVTPEKLPLLQFPAAPGSRVPWVARAAHEGATSAGCPLSQTKQRKATHEPQTEPDHRSLNF